MQITDYKVISSDSAETMQAQVQAMITEGWQPIGPVQINMAPRLPGQGFARGAASFVQTMVKYSN